VRILNPTIFYVTTAVICAVVGIATGSSWTTAGTFGVAFVGMSKVMGLPDEVAAGAVICGAYFGDKMTPLSETTILVPQLVGRGLTTEQHIRNMFWTATRDEPPKSLEQLIAGVQLVIFGEDLVEHVALVGIELIRWT
jgi:NhaC family Na+:H+ antiporter